ncbi:MAG: hypothetical protein ACXVP0_06660 [Bacteroidia bacterium]
MRAKLAFMAFLAPFVLFPQGNRLATLDAGVSSFVPFDKHTAGNPGWIYSTNNQYTFYTTSSAYLKAGAERTICSKKGVSFSIPFGFLYRTQKFRYREEGLISLPPTEYGDVLYEVSGSQLAESTIHFASLSFGPKLSVRYKSFTFFTSLNCNFEAAVSRTIVYATSYANSAIPGYTESNPFGRNLYTNLSTQNGITYHVNEHIGIGLACDVFFLNMNVFNPDGRNFQHAGNMSYAADPHWLSNQPHVVSAVFNTGIRLQYAF